MRQDLLSGAALLLLADLLACGGGGTAPAPAPSPVTPPPSAPQDAWVLTGRITTYGTSAGVPGARVSIEGGPAAETDATGVYRLSSQTPPAATPLHVTVEAGGYVRREVNVRYLPGTKHVDLDVIREAPPFSLQFYRQMVRNAYDEAAGPLEPLWRLHENPRFYVRTVDQDGRPIDPDVIARLLPTIRQSVSDWTNGTLSVSALETGTETRPRADGWIMVNITRDEKSEVCGRAYVGSTRGQITLVSDRCDCGSNKLSGALVAHEVGHALGFFHVGDRNAVMYPQIAGGCPAGQLTADERHHARLAYSRTRGNKDPDADGADTLLSHPAGPDILVEN